MLLRSVNTEQVFTPPSLEYRSCVSVHARRAHPSIRPSIQPTKRVVGSDLPVGIKRAAPGKRHDKGHDEEQNAGGRETVQRPPHADREMVEEVVVHGYEGALDEVDVYRIPDRLDEERLIRCDQPADVSKPVTYVHCIAPIASADARPPALTRNSTPRSSPKQKKKKKTSACTCN